MKNAREYNEIISKLRHFFQTKKGYIEVPAQARLSILSACEDPKTIAEFSLGGKRYPLPQTGQPELEYELLANPDASGFFCIGTSYRDEPNIIEGRHDRLFPLFEFEAKGTVDDLRQVESELLQFLGFEKPVSVNYEDVCQRYNTSEIKADQEGLMDQEISHAILLEQFPLRSNPYFNMKRNEKGYFNKIDVILYGMETIGSAERSCNAEEMKQLFYETSNGKYAKLLFAQFGKEAVMKEIDHFLSLPMIPRFGGGVGVTRLQAAMKKAGLLEDKMNYFIPARTFSQASL